LPMIAAGLMLMIVAYQRQRYPHTER